MGRFGFKNSKVVGLLLLVGVLFCTTGCSENKQTSFEEFATGVVSRVLPEQASNIVFEEIPSVDGKDLFEYETVDGKLVVRGNTGIAMCAGLNQYLKRYCNAQVSMNYNQLDLPEQLPAVDGVVGSSTPFEHRYIFNYCTYGYTMPWWDWNRWEEMIDYMAFMGINMPLATIGQEAVWQKVYKEMGMTDEQLDQFFVGPAHLPWGWMGNIDGMGGALPKNWISQRADLQVKVLERMRGLGMKPVLQGFTGHVPKELKDIRKDAKIVQIHDWAGIPGTWFLDPTDPLFKEIGNLFIKTQTEMFGTDHLYDADCFIEVDPPSNDPEFLKGVSKAVYESMAEADPEATWVIQGWFFYFRAEFWQKEQGEAFLGAIPKDKTIILDLYGEKNPTWDKTDAFFGQPWIWNVICNEDQKVNMSGDLEIMQDNFQAAFQAEGKNNLRGIGVIPEGLGYNPIIQDFIFEKAWNQDVVDVKEWVKNYAVRRYGSDSKTVKEAWSLLEETVYGRTRTMWSPLITTPRTRSIGKIKEDFRHVRADIDMSNQDPFAWDMDVYKLKEAADKLLACSEELKGEETYSFDLTNVYREFLAAFTHRFINDITVAYENKDKEALAKAGVAMDKLFDDLDEVTGANEQFLLGKWLNDARSWGKTEAESDYYDWNARTIVTIWQPKPEGGLRDYAGKQWSGLFRDYYKPRWSLLVKSLQESLDTKTEFSTKDYDKAIRAQDYKWTRSTNRYSSEAEGDIVEIAKRVQKEYSIYFN